MQSSIVQLNLEKANIVALIKLRKKFDTNKSVFEKLCPALVASAKLTRQRIAANVYL